MRHPLVPVVCLLLLVSVAPFPVQATSSRQATLAPSRSIADAEATIATADGVEPSSGGRSLSLTGPLALDGPAFLLLAGVFCVLLVGGLLLRRRRDASRASPSTVEVQSPRDGQGPSDGSVVPSEPALQTDGERVVQLLIANHGRMKQTAVVEETGWSKAKVSRLLARMEERDQIVRRREGRENVVQLADLTLAASP